MAAFKPQFAIGWIFAAQGFAGLALVSWTRWWENVGWMAPWLFGVMAASSFGAGWLLTESYLPTTKQLLAVWWASGIVPSTCHLALHGFAFASADQIGNTLGLVWFGAAGFAAFIFPAYCGLLLVRKYFGLPLSVARCVAAAIVQFIFHVLTFFGVAFSWSTVALIWSVVR